MPKAQRASLDKDLVVGVVQGIPGDLWPVHTSRTLAQLGLFHRFMRLGLEANLDEVDWGRLQGLLPESKTEQGYEWSARCSWCGGIRKFTFPTRIAAELRIMAESYAVEYCGVGDHEFGIISAAWEVYGDWELVGPSDMSGTPYLRSVGLQS